MEGDAHTPSHRIVAGTADASLPMSHKLSAMCPHASLAMAVPLHSHWCPESFGVYKLLDGDATVRNEHGGVVSPKKVRDEAPPDLQEIHQVSLEGWAVVRFLVEI